VEEKENQNQQNDVVTELEPKVKVKTELKPDDWLCIVCNKKITSDKDRFEFNDQSEFQFINPDGYYFNILTFCAARRCSNHLGWKYNGEFSFYGLIKSRLVKGAALFN
jgi:hypothetical protein